MDEVTRMVKRPVDYIYPDGFYKKIRGECPICGEKVIQENFRDEISRREFGISGMCQKCQDDVFSDEGYENG